MKTYAGLALALCGLLLVPAQASALLELEMGFEPTEACPGDAVQFFFSLENVGDQDEEVTFSVTLTFADMVFGPFEGTFHLAAGEEIAREVRFVVPMGTPPGTLVLEATAADSAGAVHAQAQVEILDCGDVPGPFGKAEGHTKKLPRTVAKALRGIGLK
ncbi:MAG: hypothetical protein KAY32_14360 [Candidatus Eisenbacteria sp.]|nr:hypothetical protein [Candidatus Eisenbacteria bacterium]